MSEPIALTVRDAVCLFDVSPPFLDRVLSGARRRVLRAVDGVSFTVRRGRMTGSRTFALAEQEVEDAEVLGSFLNLYYHAGNDVPDEVVVPLVPDAEAIARSVPRADDVLVGHAHFDHVLDAPEVCRQTGARLLGSQAVAFCGLAAGLPASQIRVTEGNEDIESGPLTLRGLPSVHGRVYFNRIPLPGDLTAPPPWPPRLRDLPHGQVLNWLVRTPTHTLVHIDSADFIDEALAPQRADILCLCAIGRHARPNYTRRAIELLQPRYVVPCHWDHFFGPFTPTPLEVPKADLAGFVEEISAAGATPVVLAPGDTLSV